jgi:FAD/FMN-containing dehydrogenase
MEHPLRVNEFPPSDAPPTAAAEGEIVPPLAEAAATPLPPLPNLPASDVQFLRPSDQHYADFLPAASKRKQLAPTLRAICKTEHAVTVMVDWVRINGLTFATRCGGHSYEGLSQTTGVAIDLRGLKQIAVDKASELVTIGSGVSLFELYSALAAQGLALQAGSCPTVGVSGHLTGGGHGLLARSHGLTCDALVEATLVEAQARVLHANAQSEPNLYWACRGGGGGSFGIATEFKIKVSL